MIKRFIFLVSFLALFLGASSVYAIDITGGVSALDYIETASQSWLIRIGAATTGGALRREVAFAYRPGASHNVCSVNILSRGQGSPTDSLAMSLRLASSTTGGPLLSTFGQLVDVADASIQVRGNTVALYTYTFTPCAVVVGGNQYNIVLYRTGSLSDTDHYWIAGGLVATPVVGTGVIYDLLYDNSFATGFGNSSNPWDIAIIGTENFSAFTASSTTTYSSSTCTPPTSILDVGGGITYAFCFLFVPNSSVINQFGTLDDLMFTKFPLNYASQIVTEWNNYPFTATTTLNTVAIPFHDLGLGSTTSMGNILPNWTALSTTTILTYMSQGQLDTFKGIMTVVTWLGFMLYAFRRVSNLIKS